MTINNFKINSFKNGYKSYWDILPCELHNEVFREEHKMNFNSNFEELKVNSIIISLINLSEQQTRLIAHDIIMLAELHDLGELGEQLYTYFFEDDFTKEDILEIIKANSDQFCIIKDTVRQLLIKIKEVFL